MIEALNLHGDNSTDEVLTAIIGVDPWYGIPSQQPLHEGALVPGEYGYVVRTIYSIGHHKTLGYTHDTNMDVRRSSIVPNGAGEHLASGIISYPILRLTGGVQITYAEIDRQKQGSGATGTTARGVIEKVVDMVAALANSPSESYVMAAIPDRTGKAMRYLQSDFFAELRQSNMVQNEAQIAAALNGEVLPADAVVRTVAQETIFSSLVSK